MINNKLNLLTNKYQNLRKKTKIIYLKGKYFH